MKWASLFGVVVGIVVLCMSIAGTSTSARAWDSGYSAKGAGGNADKQERLQRAVQVMLKQAGTQHAQLNQWHKKQREKEAASAVNLRVRKVAGGLAMQAGR